MPRPVDSLLEGAEGVGTKAQADGLCAQGREHRVAPHAPEVFPAPDALRLPGARGQEAADAPYTRDVAALLEVSEGGEAALVRFQSRVCRGAFGHVIKHMAVVVHHRPEAGKVGPVLRGHVIDAVHIGLKRRVAGEEAQHDGEEDHDGHGHAVLAEGAIGEASEGGVIRARRHAAGQEVGQKEEDEEDGADEQQGGEPPEVAHGVGVDKDEAHEGADGGDVAHGERPGDVFDHGARVGRVVVMSDEVKGVVDGDAEDDGADAHGDGGGLAADEVEQG